MLDLHKRWSKAIVNKLSERFAAREEAEGIAYVIEQMLGVCGNEARALAGVCKLRRSELLRLGQAERAAESLNSLRKMSPTFDISKLSGELSRETAAACMLSLPLTISSVLLLAQLTKDTRWHFLLLSTPLARAYLRPVVEAEKTGRVAFVSSSEMLRHNRERGATSTEPVVYVTFPDHQVTRGDTMWRVPFMGDIHQFSIIEPLLFFRGVAPLYTLNAEPNELKLVKYETEARSQAVTEREMRAVLEWLALQLETVFRGTAADVLSWESAYPRSARAVAQAAVMKLKTVEGYIHTWEEAGASFDGGTYAWAVEELRRLQETANSSVEPRRV